MLNKYYIEDATVTLRLRNFTVQANNEDEARLKAAEAAQDMGNVAGFEVSIQ